MAHAKVHKKSTNIDMTAMCDVAFLLLTFFMLATKFKPEEPVQVKTPASIQVTPYPDKDVMLITIDAKGRIFFSIDNPMKRMDMIEQINTDRQLNLSKEDKKAFALGSSIGVPFSQLKSYLEAQPDEQKKMNDAAPGVPADTVVTNATNELGDWVKNARLANPKIRICIKGDGDAIYPVINKVVRTLEGWKIFRFNLITNLKNIPPGTAAFAMSTEENKK